jgi:hypothetical protein
MAIKPGGMGQQFPSNSTPPEFADSMAAEMESILNSLLAADGLRTLPDDNSRESRDRRRLFVAIARAVVKHLDVRRGAIRLTHPGTSITTTPSFDIQGKDW